MVSEPRRLSLFIMGWVLQGSTLLQDWPHGATGAVGGESFWSVRVRGPDSGASCYVPMRRAVLYQTQGKAAPKANPVLTASATLTSLRSQEQAPGTDARSGQRNVMMTKFFHLSYSVSAAYKQQCRGGEGTDCGGLVSLSLGHPEERQKGLNRRLLPE